MRLGNFENIRSGINPPRNNPKPALFPSPQTHVQTRAPAVTPRLSDSMNPIPDAPAYPLPDTLPVMVLADCHLMPCCLLPLFIFEERYRKMLAHALACHRMFCIGTRLGADGDDLEIFPFSTAGLISVCKTQPDGTSHVILQGLRRIRLVSWEQEKPFIVARVEPVTPSVSECVEKIQSLKQQALDLLPDIPGNPGENIRQLKARLGGTACADSACDILAYHFVRRGECMRALLAETVVEKRWRILIRELQQMRAA